jgi:hypothetical protein
MIKSDWVSSTLTDVGVVPMSAVVKERTGFDDPSQVTVTYDSTTRKITLSGTFVAYWQDTVVGVLVDGWESSAHSSNLGHTYFLYYDGDTDTFAWSTDSYPGFEYLLIAFVNYRIIYKFGSRECHGLMNHLDHLSDHYNIGTYKISGGTISDYVLSSTTATNRRPSVAETVLRDEDLQSTLSGLAAAGPYTQMGFSASAPFFTASQTEILPVSGSNPYYNQYTGGVWTQTLMPANSVATVWLIGIPASADAGSQLYRFSWLQPQWITQAQNSSANALLSARTAELAKEPRNLYWGSLVNWLPEMYILTRVLVQYTGGDWTIEDVTVMTGSRYQQVGQTSGNFLSSVSCNTPISGTGSVADPITLDVSYLRLRSLGLIYLLNQ